MIHVEHFLEQIDPYTFTGSAFLLGLLLANDLTEDEQDSVGNWLQLVGMTMQTYASQVTTTSSNNSQKSSSTSTMESIEKTILRMQQEMENIKKQKY